MNRRFLITLAASAWLIGLYLLYARYLSPYLEPPQLAWQPAPTIVASTIPELDRVDSEHLAVAKSFLPKQDWARAADNQYRIGDLFLYSMEVEQLNDRAEIRFRPFAMVWRNPKGKPDEPPVRITAEAAVIRFQTAFDLDNPQPGRPVFGALEGVVEIDGPNGLKVVGRGFTFSEEALKLWSDSDILFQYGPHRATGHGMQVDFLPATETAAHSDMPRLTPAFERGPPTAPGGSPREPAPPARRSRPLLAGCPNRHRAPLSAPQPGGAVYPVRSRFPEGGPSGLRLRVDCRRDIPWIVLRRPAPPELAGAVRDG